LALYGGESSDISVLWWRVSGAGFCSLFSKLAAAVTQLANDAARGDKKAIQLAFALLQVLEPTNQAQRPQQVIVYSGVLAEQDRNA
jgi:hypothetical protein